MNETVMPAKREGGHGVRHVIVDAESTGLRLDKFLLKQMTDVPKTRVFRIVRKGEVRVNGKRAGLDQRLALGDDVRLPPVKAFDAAFAVPVASAELSAETKAIGSTADGGALPARAAAQSKRLPGFAPSSMVAQINAAVIFEDARLLVVNKPAGVAVHGGSGVSFGVIEALRAARPHETLELVHRIDRDTSGVLLVSRKPSVLRMLHAELRDGDAFEKRYLALLKGSWNLGTKRIDAPLRTDLRVGGERTVRVQAGGKESLSEFRPVQFFGARASLLEVAIFTGRTHQIRVHAQYAGHPVAADAKYGDPEFNVAMKLLGLKRMFLHAASVSFIWPGSEAEFSVNAPLPPELASVISALEGAPKLRRDFSEARARRSVAARRPAK